ncbi:hypothetical protein FB45DRAFT_732391, partial [Roridomyces roridus]
DTPAPAPSTSTPAESTVSLDSATESSESEYEAYVAEWRAQSAEAREKAEKERARWESIRAVEKREAALQQAANITVESRNDCGVSSDQDWEPVGHSQAPETSSPSPADARDLVTGEPQKNVQLESVQPPQSVPDTADESQKWEDVSSHLTSSFPSLSFPDTNAPSPQAPPPPPPPATLESATLAIFDPSLSTRTRVTALFSSIAINFMLPFINGVMLGFGEIFAKNIVLDYFGWKSVGPPPGSTAASAGLRSQDRTKSSNTTSS